MDKEVLLSLTPKEFYNRMALEIMDRPQECITLIEQITDGPRYEDDFEFRTYVQTSEVMYYSLQGDYIQMVPLCSSLIDRAIALELWDLVSINKRFLGNAYFMLGNYEIALECYYGVIKNDEMHGLNEMTSIAFNNIGLIYDVFGAYDKAYKSILHAIDFIDSHGNQGKRDQSNLIFYLSNLVYTLCKLNRLNEIDDVLKRLNSMNLANADVDAICMYYNGIMTHYFYTGKFGKARTMYYRAVDNIFEEYSVKFLEIFNNYVSLCKKFQLSHDFYELELIKLSHYDRIDYNCQSLKAYLHLRHYYQEIGDKFETERVTNKYFELLARNERDASKRKLESILIVENLINDSNDRMKLDFENTELKLMAAELINNKNELQHAYQQIELINELGKKMTSSLNLEEVVNLIYNNLSKNLPMDSFSIMMAEPEGNRLKSVAFYLNDDSLPEISISLDNKDSTFVKCYKQNQVIVNNIDHGVWLFTDGMKEVGKEDMKSAVFAPLEVENQPIGVCSMQCLESHAYTESHIRFLKGLLPYLSISLNNAIQSWSMEKEIQSYLVTQKELRKVNKRLERISSLDGLTQISSRRDFEIKFIMMIKQARQEKKEIAVFMFDIDYFKIYNDTYGHLEGDSVLKTIAHIVRTNMDSVGGLSARFGGEEFIAAATGVDKAACEALAQKMCKDIYELGIENRKVPLKRITISVGVAVAKNLSVLQKSTIMRQADISLYNAKNTGKNKVVISDYFRV